MSLPQVITDIHSVMEIIAAAFAPGGVPEICQSDDGVSVNRWKIPALIKAISMRINFIPNTPLVLKAFA